MEARTPASSTSPSKVCVRVCGPFSEYVKSIVLTAFPLLRHITRQQTKIELFKYFPCVYSEPPVPTTAPKLLEKRSKQLLVMPVDSHRGDGPIVSTRLLYKPVENVHSWSSIIGKISFKSNTGIDKEK